MMEGDSGGVMVQQVAARHGQDGGSSERGEGGALLSGFQHR
jgi:hypothetical protein